MLDQWFGYYQEPLFWSYPMAGLALSLVAFLAFALPWTALAYIDPPWARRFKIQDKPFQVASYFKDNMQIILRNNLIMLALLVAAWPLIRLTGIHDGPVPPWYVFAGQLVLFIFLDDFLYYWMHRWMHENRWMMRHVHSVHHRIKNTSAIAGNYLHPVEYLMTVGLMFIGPVLVGCHIYVLYAWIVIRQLEAADGHTGYDFPFNPLHWLPLYKGAPYHDFHHARFRGNYAGFLPYLDRYFGTYIKEYLSYRSRATCVKQPSQSVMQLANKNSDQTT